MEDEKKLKIKVNCVKRLVKERNHYIDEIEVLRGDIQQMELDNPNNYDIKKKNEILEETIVTLKHTKQMLEKYVQQLKDIVYIHLESGNISNELLDEINSIE
jgi:tubulin-specific chaperone A